MNETYFQFLDRRIPELHEEGKPEPEYDKDGRMKPRIGTYPGVLARRRADEEWGAIQAEKREEEKKK